MDDIIPALCGIKAMALAPESEMSLKFWNGRIP